MKTKKKKEGKKIMIYVHRETATPQNRLPSPAPSPLQKEVHVAS